MTASIIFMFDLSPAQLKTEKVGGWEGVGPGPRDLNGS